ncbi:MAG TPA: hypothetical protein VGH86_07685 [Phenylobacterium sp.]
MWARVAASIAGFALLLLGATSPANAQAAKHAYPRPASLEAFRMASPAEEVALARSAAPTAISADAEILVLGPTGYEPAAKGRNGFVCLVQRAWASGFNDREFWNPRNRSPICLNPAAAQSVLPPYLELTRWVIAGVPTDQLLARTKAAWAKGIGAPKTGAMSYMMSKGGYLNDANTHWHPHVMFYFLRTNAAALGANLKGSPVMGGGDDLDPVSVFFVLVPKWSDGASAMDMN